MTRGRPPLAGVPDSISSRTQLAPRRRRNKTVWISSSRSPPRPPRRRGPHLASRGTRSVRRPACPGRADRGARRSRARSRRTAPRRAARRIAATAAAPSSARSGDRRSIGSRTKHREIQREARDVGERMRRIDRQRGQDGEDPLREHLGQPRALFVVEVGPSRRGGCPPSPIQAVKLIPCRDRAPAPSAAGRDRGCPPAAPPASSRRASPGGCPPRAAPRGRRPAPGRTRRGSRRRSKGTGPVPAAAAPSPGRVPGHASLKSSHDSSRLIYRLEDSSGEYPRAPRSEIGIPVPGPMASDIPMIRLRTYTRDLEP